MYALETRQKRAVVCSAGQTNLFFAPGDKKTRGGDVFYTKDWPKKLASDNLSNSAMLNLLFADSFTKNNVQYTVAIMYVLYTHTINCNLCNN